MAKFFHVRLSAATDMIGELMVEAEDVHGAKAAALAAVREGESADWEFCDRKLPPIPGTAEVLVVESEDGEEEEEFSNTSYTAFGNAGRNHEIAEKIAALVIAGSGCVSRQELATILMERPANSIYNTNGWREDVNMHANRGYFIRPDDGSRFTPSKVYDTPEAAWVGWESEREQILAEAAT